MPSFDSITRNKFLPFILVGAGLLVSFAKPIVSKFTPAKLDVQIIPAPAIMPSIYKVYANDEALNGKYSLFKMVMTNNTNNTAENVEVSYQIPNHIETKVIQKIPKIVPGQTVVINCFPSFSEKIVEKTTSSKETVNITVKGSNISTFEESFSISCKGRNEFMYSFIPADEIRTAEENFDNMALLSCLVTPEDPIIKYLTQKIQEKLLKGEAASVENKEAEGVRVMMGIYEATLRSHMVYSGTSGVPEKFGDVSTITQSIRLPREVITGKTGLCIELSLLYASVMMCAGMDPVVYLVPGHAYPGFRMNGKYYAIESTAIGGEGMGGRSSAQEAYEHGMKSLNKFIEAMQNGDGRYMVVDIREAIKNGAVAMELKDDTFLRQKIDEIAQSFDANAIPTDVRVTQETVNYVPDNGGGGGGNTGTLPAGYKSFKGAISFGYPGSWTIHQGQGMPQCTHVISNAAQTTFIEVYNFSGYSSPQQAMNAVEQYVNQIGGSLQYQNAGQSGGFVVYNGTTTISGGGLNWVAAFKSTGNGIAGIAIGAVFGVNAEATAQKVLSTVR